MILQEKLGIENFSEIENLYRKIFKRSDEKNCIKKLCKVNFKKEYCQKKEQDKKELSIKFFSRKF